MIKDPSWIKHVYGSFSCFHVFFLVSLRSKMRKIQEIKGDEVPPVIEIPQVLGWAIWVLGPLYALHLVMPGDSNISWNHGIHFGVYLFILYTVVRRFLIDYMITMCFKFETFTFDEEIIVTSCKTWSNQFFHRFISEDKVDVRQCQVGLLHPSLKLLELQVSGWFSWCRRNAGLSG